MKRKLTCKEIEASILHVHSITHDYTPNKLRKQDAYALMVIIAICITFFLFMLIGVVFKR